MEYLAKDGSLFLNTHSDRVEFDSELLKYIVPCPSMKMIDQSEVELLFGNERLPKEKAVYDPRSNS